MHAVVGPVITREGGYAFDSWTPQTGLSRGYSYRRVEDAYYARRVELRPRKTGAAEHIVACNTMEEFTAKLAGHDISLEAVGIACIRA